MTFETASTKFKLSVMDGVRVYLKELLTIDIKSVMDCILSPEPIELIWQHIQFDIQRKHLEEFKLLYEGNAHHPKYLDLLNNAQYVDIDKVITDLFFEYEVIKASNQYAQRYAVSHPSKIKELSQNKNIVETLWPEIGPVVTKRLMAVYPVYFDDKTGSDCIFKLSKTTVIAPSQVDACALYPFFIPVFDDEIVPNRKRKFPAELDSRRMRSCHEDDHPGACSAAASAVNSLGIFSRKYTAINLPSDHAQIAPAAGEEDNNGVSHLTFLAIQKAMQANPQLMAPIQQRQLIPEVNQAAAAQPLQPVVGAVQPLAMEDVFAPIELEETVAPRLG